MTTAAARPTDAPLRGIVMMCFAVLCFSAMNTITKELRGNDLPVTGIIWGRYFFHFALILVMFPRRIPTLLHSDDKGLQVARSVLVLLATACMFVALGFMPLADAVAITFAGPLLIVALSALILRETVGPRRWGAVIVGFIGVLVIIRPGAGAFQLAALLPVAVAFFYALYQIITRHLSHRSDPLSMLFYTALVGALAMTAIVPFDWQTPTFEQWLMLVAVGFLGGLGHYAIIKAYERSETALVAPFAYTEIIWATVFGLVVFGNFPDLLTFVGTAIIVASGFYVLHRERKTRSVN
ncbi:MAG: DMT family transporter [Alphaproteobacteria bacterium]|nr:DMT family transporter [Alphaproteobacteria bacterium]